MIDLRRREFITLVGYRGCRKWPACHRMGRNLVMVPLFAAVWLLLDYPWGLLAFVAIAPLYSLR